MIPDLSAPPVDTHDVWLRLHLLSHRLIRPHGANLTGIFGLLANVAWTSAGPVRGGRASTSAPAAGAPVGHVTVFGVDKFPRMVDYVIPSGVRIADGDRVRLGAHLAEGTTVMHEGFVNFNAGTLGPSMVEGRISAGVVVGADTTSAAAPRSWARCPAAASRSSRSAAAACSGANAGIGISLGDGCVVEAGCYVTGGSKVPLPDGRSVKAARAVRPRRAAVPPQQVSGALEALPRDGNWGALNAALHANWTPPGFRCRNPPVSAPKPRAQTPRSSGPGVSGVLDGGTAGCVRCSSSATANSWGRSTCGEWPTPGSTHLAVTRRRWPRTGRAPRGSG